MTSRILIVDDHKDHADSLREILLDEEHSVEVVYTGAEALEMINGNEFDIVITDIKLPDLTGVEIFRHIQQMKLATRVILMTGYCIEAVLEQAVLEGVWAILQKPLEPLDILRMVD